MITIWPVWGESMFCLPLPGADQRAGYCVLQRKGCAMTELNLR